MTKNIIRVFVICLPLFYLFTVAPVSAQKDLNGPPLFVDVNAIKWDMKKLNGEGQFTTQYSWMLAGSGAEKTELLYYPQDEWHSQMLYQIFNPVCLDDNGCIDQLGQKKIIPTPFVSNGVNDYSWERRRYRPPYVTVDGTPLFREYRWQIDPNLPADIIASWEDILPFWGIRTRIEVYAYSNPNHDNYVIWKATYKFTGETKREIENPGLEDFFPSQTIRLWWPISFSLGPTKSGEYAVFGSFTYEGEDDLDSWFGRPSHLVTSAARDTLKIAYYWDDKFKGITPYPNGSIDDTGDPDRTTGHLLSPQIPGFSLLYAATSHVNPADDPAQPYSMPHASIVKDLWGRRDFGLRDTYLGLDSRGRFPLDAVTEGFSAAPEKGPMRFITVGPYDLTLDWESNRQDSITVVYAVGVGSISWEKADSVGKAWFAGDISDAEKNAQIMTGRDSLFQTMDRAFWAFNRDLNIPDPPPPPDVEIISDADQIRVRWSYPSETYYKDPDTGVDDWALWRVYRKKGAAFVNDPEDQSSGDRWQRVFETQDRQQMEYIDQNVVPGVSYYYAVTAIDDGSQNTDGLIPGQPLESSRYVNKSGLPAISFKAGLDETDRVRVVPNPATINAGSLGFPGDRSRILFTRLPYQCKLTIFTETGDRIASIDHFGTDQEVWDQRTDSNQYIVSGIYILAVSEAVDQAGNALSDQFVKFVVVR
ncbi:hypothetical protein JW992_02165 [candidate division KSB1 bacterium]|nr:hypothetical protein [candidate division KSB1 bacterium]